MEFGIYKLNDQYENLNKYFRTDCQLDLMQTLKATEFKLIINSNKEVVNAKISFYYKLDENNDAEINWANYWAKFFEISEHFHKIINSAFGVILIEIESDILAISLGRAFPYINRMSDMNFGLDIAEICLDEEKIDVKSAKYFTQSKNRSLTQYQRRSYVTSEVGESDDFVIGRPVFKEKYNKFLVYSYDDKIKFSNSIKINATNYGPVDFIKIAIELYRIYENEKTLDYKLCNLPRLSYVKNNEDNAVRINDLNNKLLNDIKNLNGETSLSYFFLENSEVITKPLDDDSISLVFNRKSYSIDYSLESISEVLRKIKCNDLSKVSVKNESTNIRKKIINFLDFNIKYRSDYYCIINGRWALFNLSFLKHIKSHIRYVNDIVEVNQSYNLTDELLKYGKVVKKKRNIKNDVEYTEYLYNLAISDENNFKCLDRKKDHDLFKNVEFADLYDNEKKSLIHVKIGATGDFRYCVKQSLNSAEIFNIHDDVLNNYGIDKVDEIALLLVINQKNIVTDTGEIDFSKSNSMYFKIELINWFNKVRSINRNPKIYVSFDRRQ